MNIQTLRNKIANSSAASLVDLSTNDTEIIFIAYKSGLIDLKHAVEVYSKINPQHVRALYTNKKTVTFDSLLDFSTTLALGVA